MDILLAGGMRLAHSFRQQYGSLLEISVSANDHEIDVEETPAHPLPNRRHDLSPRRRRILYWATGIILVVALLESIGWPFLRVPIQAGLARALGREVQIEAPFAIRFIGHLRVRAEQFRIGPAPVAPTLDGRSLDLLRASQLRLSVPYTTLFSLIGEKKSDGVPAKRPFIRVLEVAALEATLLRDADGHANWRFGTQGKDDSEKESAPLGLPEFGRLALGKAAITVDDALNRIDVQATVQTDANVVPGTNGKTAGVEASARGRYQDRDFSARLWTDGLLTLADSDTSAPPAPLRLELRAGANEVDFDGQASDVLHLAGVTGRYRLAGQSLASFGGVLGLTLPTTAAFAMRGTLDKEGAVWSTVVSELTVGKSRLNGEFRYDPTLSVPKLSGRLAGALLSMPDLAPAVGAPPKANNGATKVTTSASPAKTPHPRAVPRSTDTGAAPRVLPQRAFNTPSLARMDADVTVALEQFDLGTATLARIAPLRAHVILEKQVLTLGNIVARTASGEVLGTISFDARDKTPLWKADLRWSGVQLERFVKPRDVADRDRAGGYITGTLAGRSRLSGSGTSTAAILATLDGDAQMWVSNGTISHFLIEVFGLDVAQALGMLVRGDASLPMRCAVASLSVQDGTIRPEVAVIETSDSTLRVTGNVSLGDERLGLEFRAQPKDVSPISLRSPVFIQGTFSDPQIKIDKTSVGMRVVAAAALAAVTPLASILALIDLGEGEKKVCQDAVERLQRAAPRPTRAPAPGAGRGK